MSYFYDRQYGLLSHQRLLNKLKNSSSITRRLTLDYKLNVHRGCVNTIWWNEQGTTILSGSDDQNLIVTDAFTQKVLTKVHSGHRENIFSAKFLPETNDRRVVSCSGDGVIFHTNFDRPPSTHSIEGCFKCHGLETAYEVRIIPRTPNLFLSCSNDCTIRLYDLRTKSNCLKDNCNEDILIKSHWAITSMDINPMNSNEIVCACADGSIRLYDHRKLSTQIPSAHRSESSIHGLISYFKLSDQNQQQEQHHQSRITSVVYNPYGTEILASYSSESVYLLDPKQMISQEKMKDYLLDHRNRTRTTTHTKENKPTAINNNNNNNEKTSPVKRLRLRGDWSDTGPDSRPINEEQSPPTADSPSTPIPERNPQNVFMQRMSDLLTQLVTRTTTTNTDTQDPEPSGASDRTSPNPIGTDPIVQSPSSPETSSTTTTTTTNDNEDTPSESPGIFDMFLGGNRGFRAEDEDDEGSMDDDGDDDDDEDKDENGNSSTTNDNSRPAERARRAFIPTKWQRIRKRREAERSQEETLLKNIPSLGLLNSYTGHRNARTMIKEANFWSENYVMSGSDCGNIFIWNKHTARVVRVIEADGHVVNCVQPHPLNYPILASSGIDYNIKIFSPIAETPIDDSERIQSAIKRNHAMTEETSSTITVPASFIFRMLTSIYRLRQSEDMSGLDDDDDDE